MACHPSLLQQTVNQCPVFRIVQGTGQALLEELNHMGGRVGGSIHTRIACISEDGTRKCSMARTLEVSAVTFAKKKYGFLGNPFAQNEHIIG